MNKKPKALALRLINKGNADLDLTADERNQISAELKKDIPVVWLPETGKTSPEKPDPGKAHLALETALLIFAGTAFTTIVSPFVAGAAGEAGKDFWQLVKKLAARVWNKQSDRAYNLVSKANIIFELDSAYVAVEISTALIPQGKGTIPAFEAIIEEKLGLLASHWDEISAEVSKQNKNKKGKGPVIYWVRVFGTEWSVLKINDWTFLN